MMEVHMRTMMEVYILYSSWEYANLIMARLPRAPGGGWTVCAAPHAKRLKSIAWAPYPPLGQ